VQCLSQKSEKIPGPSRKRDQWKSREELEKRDGGIFIITRGVGKKMVCCGSVSAAEKGGDKNPNRIRDIGKALEKVDVSHALGKNPGEREKILSMRGHRTCEKFQG